MTNYSQDDLDHAHLAGGEQVAEQYEAILADEREKAARKVQETCAEIAELAPYTKWAAKEIRELDIKKLLAPRSKPRGQEGE